MLAHAWLPFDALHAIDGDVHFDNGNAWATAPGSSVDILEVMVHELGHSLGLGHEETLDAIMNPYYGARYSGLGTAFLLTDDIAGIRDIYGSGTGAVHSAVPEPSSLVLWSGLGAMGLIAAWRRRKRAA